MAARIDSRQYSTNSLLCATTAKTKRNGLNARKKHDSEFDFMRRACLMVIQFQFVLCHPDLYGVRD